MIPPYAVRPEYIDSALEKTTDAELRTALLRIKELAVEITKSEVTAFETFLENRRKSGEDPKKIRVPASVQSMSFRAAEDMHLLELRKCRRATAPAQIIESLLHSVSADLVSWKNMAKVKDATGNHLVTEEVVVQKERLLREMENFLRKCASAT